MDHNAVGRLGENIASTFLTDKGYKVIDRNYRKKFGEIDIIAEDGHKILHFVEVKTVTRENISDVIRETGENYRPEDNLHPWKLKRLSRAIQVYLTENNVSPETPWMFDVCSVVISINSMKARVKFLKDIII